MIVFSLLAVLAVYAAFFLVFKLIWILLKKNSNKGPLIWAGVSTVLFGVALAVATLWCVHKVTKPFQPIIAAAKTAAPQYGSRVYTDPETQLQVTVFDGMTFGDWISFDDWSFKAGVDTNIFKKDAAGKDYEGPVTWMFFIRQNKTEENFLQDLQEAFKQNHRRNLEVLKQEDITVSGRPALFVSALVYSNNGDSMPISALIVPTQDGAVYYFVSSQLGAADQTKAEEMLKSVVFP